MVSLWCICCTVGMLSCADDKGKDYPSLVTDLVVVEMDGAGMMAAVKLDNGERYDVHAQVVGTQLKDTLIRCLASYVLTDGQMTLYSISSIFSSHPCKAESLLQGAEGNLVLDSLPRDPVRLVSLWKSGGYVNMQIGVLTTGKGTHAYAFCEDSVGHYSLVHLRPADDAESYTQKVYLSMPIPENVEHPTFSLRTYDGLYTRSF